METKSIQARPVFKNVRRTDFFNSVKASVADYFIERGIKQTGNRVLYIKAAILVTTCIALYVSLIFFHPQEIVSVFLCILLGINLGAIGFNIMHDACHGSFSGNRLVNTMWGLSLNVMGGNSDWWKEKHNIFHHTYTNIADADEDISIPFIRAHREQPRKWYHQYQHWYWPCMYALTYFAWIFIGDFKKYFSNKIGTHPFSPITRNQHLMFWASKLLYGALFIVLPMMQWGWESFLIGYAIVLGVCGMFIAIIFQLAHLVEDTRQPVAFSGTVENEWAIHQVETTANFGTRNKILYWLCGGLNFQIEHHLFPKISHVHYRALQSIVKQKCEEYGIAYNEKPTLLHAIRSHIKTLKMLGKLP